MPPRCLSSASSSMSACTGSTSRAIFIFAGAGALSGALSDALSDALAFARTLTGQSPIRCAHPEWSERVVADRRRHHQEHQIDQPGIVDRMIHAGRQEDVIVLAHDVA